MAYVSIEEQYLKDIGNNIRNKNNEVVKYKPREMADAIRGLSAISTEALENLYLSDGIVNFTYTHIPVIGKFAFAKSEKLRVVDTAGVVELKDSAFSECALDTVNLPNLTKMGTGVFSYGSYINNINIPKITTLPDSTFSGFQGSSLTLPSITTIEGRGVFSSAALNTINMPNLTTINGQNTFANCKNLTNINLPELTTINGKNTFWQNTGFTTLKLPKLKKILDAGATFAECSAKTIILPTLTQISYATNSGFATLMFSGCDNLEALVLASPQKVSVSYATSDKMFTSLNGKFDVFYNRPSDSKAFIYVPKALLSSYQNDTSWTKYYKASVFRAIEDYPEIGALL